MACGCGKVGKANVSAPVPANGKSSGKFSLTMPDGSRTFYDTETAARAANQTAGGRGLVRRLS